MNVVSIVRLDRAERKIKELSMGYYFIMLTTKVDDDGVLKWENLKKMGMTDKLFSWNTNPPLEDRRVTFN